MDHMAGCGLEALAIVLGIYGASGKNVEQLVAGPRQPKGAGRARPEACLHDQLGAIVLSVQNKAARFRPALDRVGPQVATDKPCRLGRLLDMGRRARQAHAAFSATFRMSRAAFSAPLTLCMRCARAARRLAILRSLSSRSIVDASARSVQR